MAADSSLIYVYDCFSKEDPVILGYLYVDRIRGAETYSFEYDADWLNNLSILLFVIFCGAMSSVFLRFNLSFSIKYS